MRKRGFGKKGSEATQKVLLILFQAIFATVIAISLFSYVRGVETNQAFEKKYLSRDISLLISALYSVPGDVRLEYEQDKIDLSLFSFKFEDYEVKIRGLKHETGLTSTNYPYLVDTNLVSKTVEVSEKKGIPLQKEGDNVNLGKIEDVDAFDCPEVPRYNFLKPIIDPGHGDSDKGLIGPTLVEEELTSTIARALKPRLPSAEYTRPLEKGNREITIEERVKKAREGDFIISIHANTDPDITNNELVVYYPAGDRESMGIACKVAWNIFSGSDIGYTGFNFLPLPANMIRPTEDYFVLSQGKGIIVEVGNINDPLMPYHLNAVVIGIGEGVR